MKRTVSAVLVISSLVICLASVALWVRSRCARDERILLDRPKAARVLVSDRGALFYVRALYDEETEAHSWMNGNGLSPSAARDDHAALTQARQMVDSWEPVTIGFNSSHRSTAESNGSTFTAEETRSFWITYSAVGLVTSILPLVWVYRVIRARLRARKVGGAA